MSALLSNKTNQSSALTRATLPHQQSNNTLLHKEDELDRDVYSIMTLSKPLLGSWFLVILSFVLQLTLGVLVILDQTRPEFSEITMKIPIKITMEVQIAQFAVIILTIMTQTDVLMGFRMIILFSLDRTNTWKEMIDDTANSNGSQLKDSEWYWRILLPNALKVIEVILVLIAIFVIIIQSDSVVELLKDYAALLLFHQLIIFFLHWQTRVFLEKKVQIRHWT